MLTADFFARSAVTVAEDLIGCFLVVETEDGRQRLQITEAEAYLGPEDTASHARFGATDRTEVMWAQPAVIYVYLSYGVHEMLNVVTGEEADPQAVLIRGAGAYDGPGKLTKALGINRDDHNKQMLSKETGVWIDERTGDFGPVVIERTPRNGIDGASAEWQRKPLRFIDATTD